MGIARNLDSLRIHRRWTANRPADRGTAVARKFSAAPGQRLRESHGLAQTETWNSYRSGTHSDSRLAKQRSIWAHRSSGVVASTSQSLHPAGKRVPSRSLTEGKPDLLHEDDE